MFSTDSLTIALHVFCNYEMTKVINKLESGTCCNTQT